MHICIEIIFSELYLRVCHIYKYHPGKDIVLDMDFLLSLFLLSFLGQSALHLFGWNLVLGNLFNPCCVLEIKTSHCFVVVVVFGWGFFFLHHIFQMK